jgi:hypothetical protein
MTKTGKMTKEEEVEYVGGYCNEQDNQYNQYR